MRLSANSCVSAPRSLHQLDRHASLTGGTTTIWFRRESVVRGLEVEAHQAEQRVQENRSKLRLALAKRQAEDDPQRQRGQDREVRVSPLASAQAVLRWCPRGDRLFAQPA